ncbi:MAG TPA: hypothetical protein VNT57_03680 [Desulfobacteria bacterium]|nr:hypothetical protein [Desulfobacteria bacterium]
MSPSSPNLPNHLLERRAEARTAGAAIEPRMVNWREPGAEVNDSV